MLQNDYFSIVDEHCDSEEKQTEKKNKKRDFYERNWKGAKKEEYSTMKLKTFSQSLLWFTASGDSC